MPRYRITLVIEPSPDGLLPMYKVFHQAVAGLSCREKAAFCGDFAQLALDIINAARVVLAADFRFSNRSPRHEPSVISPFSFSAYITAKTEVEPATSWLKTHEPLGKVSITTGLTLSYVNRGDRI